jgi:hypothetical protein
LIIDDEGAVRADRQPNISAGAFQHVDARDDLLGLDLDIAEVSLSERGSPGDSAYQEESGQSAQHGEALG